MADRKTLLVGFEDAVANAIAQSFRFGSEGLKSIPLTAGRHLFVQDLPQVEEIIRTAAADLIPYEPTKEPAICLYTAAGGPKGINSASSGARHEVSIEIVLRISDANEDAKKLLEELVTYIVREFQGLVAGPFQIKRSVLIAAPSVIGRQGDDHVLVSSTVKFFAVPMPT